MLHFLLFLKPACSDLEFLQKRDFLRAHFSEALSLVASAGRHRSDFGGAPTGLLVMLVMNSRWEQINERVRNCSEATLRFINTTMKMPVKLWYEYTQALKKLFFLLMKEGFKITSFCPEQHCQGKLS